MIISFSDSITPFMMTSSYQVDQENVEDLSTGYNDVIYYVMLTVSSLSAIFIIPLPGYLDTVAVNVINGPRARGLYNIFYDYLSIDSSKVLTAQERYLCLVLRDSGLHSSDLCWKSNSEYQAERSISCHSILLYFKILSLFDFNRYNFHYVVWPKQTTSPFFLPLSLSLFCFWGKRFFLVTFLSIILNSIQSRSDIRWAEDIRRRRFQHC